jgi:Na+-transporting NADH:ubiquinone oxidoreductase subunit C
VGNNDTIKKTVIVTLLLCLVCSIIVSVSAVLLRPAQTANKALDFKRNILAAADLQLDGKSIEEVFEERVIARVVDLDTGRFTDAVDPETFDQRRAAKDASLSTSLSSNEDIAKISRRENYSIVYLVEAQGELQRIILPIKGYGLWSTLYGFLALEADVNTVAGLVFYEHAETPGLGGEVDNPAWRGQWSGKEVYNADGSIAITVLKGTVDPNSSNAIHQVDGLSGATLTARGVHNLLHFWLGENGYKPFLANLTNGEA